MTQLKNLVAIGAAAVLVAATHNAIAQDDLDDLLRDLEAETPAEQTPAPAAEAPAEETPVAEAEETPVEVEPATEEPATATEEPAPVVGRVAPNAPQTAEEPAVVVVETPVAEPEDSPVVADVAPAAPETPAEEPAVAEPAVADVEPATAEPEPATEEPAPVVAATAEPAFDSSPRRPDVAAIAGDRDLSRETADPATAGERGLSRETATPAPSAVFTGPDAELLGNLSETQRNLIKASIDTAKRKIEEARVAMKDEEYVDAIRHYANAAKLLNDSPKLAGLRKECQQGIAEGLFRAALQEDALGCRDRALKYMEKAIARRHPKARRVYESWIAAGDPDANKTDVSEIMQRRNEDSYKELRAKNNQHLKRARQFLGLKDLKNALDECELVLVADPYNEEAIRIRNAIQKKRHHILMKEREAARDGMMADVDEAWRPVYAVDARAVEEVRSTKKTPIDMLDPERAEEQAIEKRMKEMILPSISFKPPATLGDALEFFKVASKDYDRPEIPVDQRGFNFYLKLPESMRSAAAQTEAEPAGGGFAADDDAPAGGTGNPLEIPMLSANNISFYDALKLVCEAVNFKFKVQNKMIVVMHKDASTEEMATRSYPVLSTFIERMSAASEDMQSMQQSGFNRTANNNAGDEENQEAKWKQFFELLGVKWPEGSQLMYIKTIGKLRVKNTYENLAELEQALTEMNADPKLIEIEARFVEVCQEDLNSLGFEWILNSDYSLNLGAHAARALGLRNGVWGSRSGSTTSSSSSSTSTDSSSVTGGVVNNGGTTTTTTGNSTSSSSSTRTVYANSSGASWIRGDGRSHHNRSVGVNSFGGENSDYSSGQRYLSTLSNHISGEGYSTNDQFMRLNAFLGGADLSMILHMLSQRSDTDLLSAPKVLTTSDSQAVIKVVTEYIYPTDYDVQLQSSSSGSSGSSGSSQSAILAVVEPQSFTMREVGVILDVTPTLTDDGNLINLKLNTQVVDEPTWKNYGMRIPFTGNSSLQSFDGIGGILEGLSAVLATLGTGISDTARAAFAETAVSSASSALENLTASGSDTITYYDAPMEQPFFHVRSIDSTVQVYPGATIVMGGLITEARKAMDDKIPFLGDIPFIGRLFRSHSEQTSKRNLLIFVTTRLVDVRGRELSFGSAGEARTEGEVKPAPGEG